MERRFVNVQYGQHANRIRVVDMEDLSELEDAIKAKFGELIPVPPTLILLFDQQNNLITDLDDIADDYFKRLKHGGHALTIRTSPPPSRLPSEAQLPPSLFPTDAATDDLTDFWTALRNCETPIRENEVVRLPPNTFILGNPTLGSSIYIRHCYPSLLDTVMKIIHTPSTPHLVILGNPGIGKTFFGFVLLLHLVRSGATVVYESGKEKCRYLFSPNFVGCDYSRSAFHSLLRSTNTYYIVDARTPVDVAAKTILLSSPRRDVWYKFSNDRCTIRNMPIWSREEIQSCRGLLFPHVEAEFANALFDKWGGVPKFVLENAHNAEQQAKLDSAISSVDLDAVIKCIGNPAATESITHHLVHIHVADDFMTTTYRFASDYVVDGIYTTLFGGRKRQQLIEFISVSQGIGLLSTLCGTLFERHAHTVIASGGVFKIRELLPQSSGSEEVFNLKVPSLPTLVFHDDSQIVTTDGYYYRPRVNNYESVDSFIKPNMLFQMTSAKKHPCKQVGINKVLNLLGSVPDPRLYFVVPKDRFNDFKYQKYEDANGRIMQEPSYLNVKQVKQFVLTIDLSSR